MSCMLVVLDIPVYLENIYTVLIIIKGMNHVVN